MKKRFIILAISILTLLVTLVAASKVIITSDKLVGGLKNNEPYTFIGHVVINRIDEIYVETPLATATKGATDWENFTTEGETFVRFQTGEATSLALEYNLNDSTGVMSKEVMTKIYSKQEDEKDIYIYKTNILKFDQKNEYYEGFAKESEDASSQLIFIDYKGDLKVDTNYFEYFGNTGLLNLKGNVFVEDEKNSRKIWASELMYNTEDDSFEGLNVKIELVF